MTSSTSTGQASSRRQTIGVSESWDQDFLFQNSASDLHLPFQHASSTPQRTPRRSRTKTTGSPYGQGTRWPSPSDVSLAAVDADEEPTLHALSPENCFRIARAPHGSRNASHSSTASSAVATSSDWRSATPSLASDWGGGTTTTADDTDWDELRDLSSDDVMTEVDSAQNHFAPPPLSFRRSVSGRIASVFKGKQKQSDEPQPPPPTALSSNTSPTDHDLPPDLRTFTALRSSPERITIIPHTPRRRRRADSSGTETYPTPSSNKPVNNTTASPSRKRDSTRSASRRQSQDTFLKVDDETRTTTTATSSHALLEAQPLAPLQSRTDEEGLSNVSTTSVDAGSTRARRKLKRRSQALPPSPHRTGSKVLSQVPTQNSLPSGTSCKDEAPRRLKKRPLSLTGIFNKQPSEDPQPNPSTPKSPSVPSNWFRLHRPSASIGSTSGNESHQSLNEAVLSPPPSTTSLTFQQPQGFFRSRIFNKPTSDPVTAASSPTAPTAPRSSPEQRRKSSSSPPKRSLSKRRPQALLHRSSAPFDPTAATLTDTTPECSGFNDMHSNDPSEPPTPRRPLPPIGLVKQPNSGEQLGSRTLAENDAETSPSTAKRPSSYFTVATNSSRGLSPDESLFNPTTGSTVQRRLSLSDLRIPTSITEAQQKIGADLQRVKEFKTGVEDLKLQRASFMDLLRALKATPQSSSRKPKSAKAAGKIHQQYVVYWECCDVLIDLADGSDNFSLWPPRPRCVSEFPTRTSPGKNQEEARHLELLREMLGSQQTSPERRPSVAGASRSPIKLTKSAMTRDAEGSKKPAISKLSILNIRDFLQSLRRDSAQKMSSHQSANQLSPARPFPVRSVSEPPVTPTKTRMSPRACLEEDEEDWDRSSSSSGGTSMRRSSTSDRGRSSSRLPLDGTNFPKLIECLGIVQERCSACITELEMLQ